KPGSPVAWRRSLQDPSPSSRVRTPAVLSSLLGLASFASDTRETCASAYISRSCPEFLTEALEPAADARVEAKRACLEHHAADQVGIDFALGLDLAPRRLLDLLHDRAGLLVGKLDRRRQLDAQLALLDGDQALELLGD